MIARFFDITSYLRENTATPYLKLTFAGISSYEEVESVRTGLIVPLPVASQHDEKGIEQRQPFVVLWASAAFLKPLGSSPRWLKLGEMVGERAASSLIAESP
jgi:hypothetical protein